MVLREGQFERRLAALQQPLQFEHAFARHDHLPAHVAVAGPGRFRKREAMAIGRHRAQAVAADLQQQAIQVVAHVLHGHGERTALQHLLETALIELDPFDHFAGIGRREFARRQGRQGELAAPGLDLHAIAVLRQLDLRAVGQGTHDVEELACRHRDLASLARIDCHARRQLDFEVGGRETGAVRVHTQQHVGEDRQGLSPFNYTDDLLQRPQQGFSLDAQTHGAGSYSF
jgi:hypothetical protein